MLGDRVLDDGEIGGRDRLEAVFPQLSPQLKLAARYVLDAPDEIAFGSLRDVAARAGVHPSTFVRLAKRLDYGSFAAFRERFRDRLKTRPTSFSARAQRLRGEDRNAGSLLAEVEEDSARNLHETLSGLGEERLERIARAVVAARTVHLVGLRKCYPIAWYLHYALRMFREQAVLLGGQAGTLVDQIRDIRAEDLLIAVSYDPYTRETVTAVEAARGAGATIVAITDSAISPLARRADETVLVANAGPSFFRSISAALTVAEAIVAAAYRAAGEEAAERLRDGERQLRSANIYWGGAE